MSSAVSWVEDTTQHIGENVASAAQTVGQTVSDAAQAVASSPITQDVLAGVAGAAAGVVTGALTGLLGGPVGVVAGAIAGGIGGAVAGTSAEISSQNAANQAAQQAQTNALSLATATQTADISTLESYFGSDYLKQGFTVSIGDYNASTGYAVTISDASGNLYTLGSPGTANAGQVLYANGPNTGQVAMGIVQKTALATATSAQKAAQQTINQTYGDKSGYTVSLGTYDPTTGQYGISITDASGNKYSLGSGTNANLLYDAKTNTQVQTPDQIAAAAKAAADQSAAATSNAQTAAATPALSTNPTQAATGTPDLSAGNKTAAAAAASTTISNLPDQAAVGSFIGNQEIQAQQQTNQQTIETNNFVAAQSLAASKFNTQQGEQQSQQTTSEQNAYVSANEQVQSAQEQIGSEKASAAAGQSTIVSNAALRGIRVSAGAANPSQTPDLVSDSNGKLSISNKGALYQGSPLAQLVAYQSNANLEIANAETGTASASNLASSEIVSGTAAFEQNMSDQLAEFNAQQAQDLSQFNTELTFNQNAFNENQAQSLAAYQQGNTFNQINNQIDLSQQTSESALAEQFTQENLQSYDTSLWINAFSDIISQSSGAAQKFGVTQYQTPEPTLIGTDWGMASEEPMSGRGY